MTAENTKPKCKLVGTDGNIFALVGKASRTLKQAGLGDEATEMTKRACGSQSYHEALAIIQEYVEAY